LTGFIEAADVSTADSGGVKNDHVFPKKDESSGISSKEGYINVPFPRTEYVAKDIRAYFNIDLALIRGLGLGTQSELLLIALSLFKIRRFLDEGLRLRSYCALEIVGDWEVSRPAGYRLPNRSEIEEALLALIEIVAGEGRFADPRISRITWTKGKKKKEKKEEGGGEKRHGQ
jgi:CRISPR-associated protein Csb1